MVGDPDRGLTRLGLQVPAFGPAGAGEHFSLVCRLAAAAEASGFDSLWVMDHFQQIPYVGAPEDPMLEAYTLLGALAARSSTLRLGALVSGVTYRNPALLAKMVTTLDVISGGRAILGIGAAWYEQEHLSYGYDFPPARERLERLEEALCVARAMFGSRPADFQGRHYRIRGAINSPPPYQSHLPILVGGSGEKVTLRLVARYADACNLFGDPQVIRAKLAVLDRHCDAQGRDRAAVWRTRLGSLLLGETAAEADRLARDYMSARGLDAGTAASVLTWGDADQVRHKAAELLDCGLDGLIFNMALPGEVSQVEMAGEALSPLLGPSRRR